MGIKNKRTKEAGWVEKNIKSLKGYYLPYQIVKGPVRCTVFREQAFSDKNISAEVLSMVWR